MSKAVPKQDRLERAIRTGLRILILIAAVAFGVRTQFFWNLWAIHERPERCSGGVCVGDPESDLKRINPDDIGGLQSEVCGPLDPTGIDLNLAQIIGGAHCTTSLKTLFFQSGAKAVVMTINQGRIQKIVVRPAHRLDP